MIEFFLKDILSLVGIFVILGGVVLFILTLKHLMRFGQKVETITEEEQAATLEEKKEETSLVLAHMEAISADLHEIKQKLDSIQSVQENLKTPRGESQSPNTEDILKKISAKLEILHKILSSLAEE